MTAKELRQYRRPAPLLFAKLGIKIDPAHVEDAYGVYETGVFEYKDKTIIITIEDGHWHLSAACKHTIGYYELKELRYKFMPNAMQVAPIFPPREEFINVHENCFHLYQIKNDEDDFKAYAEDGQKFYQNHQEQ